MLESEREEVSKQNQAKQEKADELKKYNLLLGLTDVSGEGITITAKDGTINKATDNISSYLVHDADLREIVNELANAGAEAISINDQRIVNHNINYMCRKYYFNKWRKGKFAICNKSNR